jgi:hypothetical protein
VVTRNRPDDQLWPQLQRSSRTWPRLSDWLDMENEQAPELLTADILRAAGHGLAGDTGAPSRVVADSAPLDESIVDDHDDSDWEPPELPLAQRRRPVASTARWIPTLAALVAAASAFVAIAGDHGSKTITVAPPKVTVVAPATPSPSAKRTQHRRPRRRAKASQARNRRTRRSATPIVTPAAPTPVGPSNAGGAVPPPAPPAPRPPLPSRPADMSEFLP